MTTDTQRRKKIQTILDRWIPRLSLTSWDISYRFKATLSEGDSTPAARINVPPPYLRAHIVFACDIMDHLTLKEWERVVVHELLHCVLQPIAYQIELILGTETDISSTLRASFEPVADHLALVLSHMSDRVDGKKPIYAIYSP